MLDDIIDVESDMKAGYPTLAITRGPITSSKCGALFCPLAVILLPLPYIVGVVTVTYLLPIVLVGCVAFYLTLSVFKKPDVETVRRLHKKLAVSTVVLPIALAAGVFLLR